MRLMTEKLKELADAEAEHQLADVSAEAISTNGLARIIDYTTKEPETAQLHERTGQLYIPGQAPFPHVTIEL